MRTFGLLVTTEQASKSALLRVPTVEVSDARLSANKALSLLKDEPDRVIGALEACERGEATDDAVNLFFFLNVILDDTPKREPDGVLVLCLQPGRADLLSLPEDDAKTLVLRFDRGDA